MPNSHPLKAIKTHHKLVTVIVSLRNKNRTAGWRSRARLVWRDNIHWNSWSQWNAGLQFHHARMQSVPDPQDVFLLPCAAILPPLLLCLTHSLPWFCSDDVSSFSLPVVQGRPSLHPGWCFEFVFFLWCCCCCLFARFFHPRIQWTDSETDWSWEATGAARFDDKYWPILFERKTAGNGCAGYEIGIWDGSFNRFRQATVCVRGKYKLFYKFYCFCSCFVRDWKYLPALPFVLFNCNSDLFISILLHWAYYNQLSQQTVFFNVQPITIIVAIIALANWFALTRASSPRLGLETATPRAANWNVKAKINYRRDMHHHHHQAHQQHRQHYLHYHR